MLKNKLNLGAVLLLIGIAAMFSVNMNNTTAHLKQYNDNKELLEVGEECSDDPIYKKIIAMKKKYPNGKKWTNRNSYAWKGGVYAFGNGCLGFAFLLSDAAFGDKRAKKHKRFNDIKIGDILRINRDTHSVVVLCITDNEITVAEGNLSKRIYWGRKFTKKEMRSKFNYALTRY